MENQNKFKVFFSKFEFNAIDFLRIMAMLFVVILHVTIGLTTGAKEELISTFGIFAYFPAWAGVWIFFFISAYLNISGFLSGKYEFSLKGILTFYKKRFLKLYPLYILYFIFCLFAFNYPDLLNNPEVILRVIFLQYNGIPGINYFGSAWFVSTICQFYLLCPLFAYVIKKIATNKNRSLLLFFFVACIGLLVRLILVKNGVEFYTYIYTPIYGNIDIFFCGGLLIQIIKYKDGKNLLFNKIFSLVLFFVCFVSNCYFYYANQSVIYEVVYPFLWIFCCSYLIFAFPKSTKKASKYSLSKILVANSYEVFLFHPAVFYLLFSSTGENNAFFTVFLMLSTIVVSVAVSICIKAVAKFLKQFILYITVEESKPLFKKEGLFKSILVSLLLVVFYSAPIVALNFDKIVQKKVYINNVDEYLNLANDVNNGNEYRNTEVILNSDIDFANMNTPTIGVFNSNHYFYGTFNGNGYRLKNVNVSTGGANSLFGMLGGTVINFYVESGTVIGDALGGIASHTATSEAKIINSYTNVDVYGSRTGGIADNFNGAIINCWSTSTLHGNVQGGIVSYTSLTLLNSYSIQEPTNSNFNGTIKNCKMIPIEEMLSKETADLINSCQMEIVSSTNTDVTTIMRVSFENEFLFSGYQNLFSYSFGQVISSIWPTLSIYLIYISLACGVSIYLISSQMAKEKTL